MKIFGAMITGLKDGSLHKAVDKMEKDMQE